MQFQTAPVRIGFLDDVPGGMDRQRLARVSALALEDVAERFTRPVEWVVETVNGPPYGTAKALEDGYAKLVEAGVLAILGPALGDGATVATPLAERAEMPTLHYAGAERARGQWTFHLQIGSHEEEPFWLARRLAEAGRRRVALIFERAEIGSRYARYFEEACEVFGIEQAARIGVIPGSEDAERVARAAVGAAPQAVVYLGLGVSHGVVAAGLRAAGLDVPRLTNTCGMFGFADPDAARGFEGWIYLDMVSERNLLYTRLLERLAAKPEEASSLAFLYELHRLGAEALARAPELTRPGLRAGFERIKPIPSVLGEPGTFAGFGPFDRGALKGPYMVFRRWSGGASIEAQPGDFDPIG